MGNRLPTGVQSILKILENDEFVYVDKTHYALQLITNGAPHNFMSRPRRFGKSLFLSTLEEIFKGNKQLFSKCFIYKSNYKWPVHPVLYFDFSCIPYTTSEIFERGLIEDLHKKANDHGVSISGSSLEMLLANLVEALAKKNEVVILIDEYDKPIIDHLHSTHIAEENRSILKQFYTILKSLDKYLKFTFMTGVSKFTQVSLFSGPNHIDDITLDTKYAQMMGYTKDDLLHYFDQNIKRLMQTRNCSEESILDELKEWYNGYRFAENEELVYNPFSTLLYFQKEKAQGYWFRSGTPSFLIEQVKKCPISLLCLSQSIVSRNRLSDICSLEDIDLPSLMFQTGYLTIRDYFSEDDSFSLDFPNREVRQAFFNSLIDHFAQVQPRGSEFLATEIQADLDHGDFESFTKKMNQHFAKIPYHLFKDAKEGFFHAVFLTFLEKSGLKTMAEIATNIGRIDLVAESSKSLFIFELKVDKNSECAFDQAETKKYQERYEQTKKNIFIIGINFDTKQRNISDWRGKLFSTEGKLLTGLIPRKTNPLVS